MWWPWTYLAGWPLTLDPEVFCCKLWSKMISDLNKHEIWPQYGILNQWWLHTKLKKTSKGVFTVLSSSWRYPVCVTFRVESLNESWFQTKWYGYTNFDCSPSQSHLPETTVAWKHQEYSYTFYRVTPNMCTIYKTKMLWKFDLHSNQCVFQEDSITENTSMDISSSQSH